MPRYMLDTDISSYIMKRSHEALLKRLRRTAVEDVCISVITHAELEYGVEVSPRKSQDAEALQEYLRFTQVLDFPAEASHHYAEIRAHLKKKAPSSARTICSSRPMPARSISRSSPTTHANSTASPASKSKTGPSPAASTILHMGHEHGIIPHAVNIDFVD